MSKIHDALRKAQRESGAPDPIADLQGQFSKDFENNVFNLEPIAAAPEAVPETLSPVRKLDASLGTAGLLPGNDGGIHSEAFRRLRISLQQIAAVRPTKVILITSAVQEEGKSFVCANLGLSLARKDQKTLLIDADLYRHGLSNILGAHSAPGLQEYLLGQAEISGVIQNAAQDDLFVIGAGDARPHNTDLLNGERMKRAIAQLRTSFDWIVIDSPAALPLSDARELAPLTDGVLIVVRSGSTNRDAARKVHDMFRGSALGVVLNRARVQTPFQYGYNGYAKAE